MDPNNLDIEIQRNADWSKTITFTGQDGQPLDLTNATFVMRIKRAPGMPGPSLAPVAVAIVPPATNGQITITIDGQALSAAVPDGPQQIVTLAYDLIGTQAGFDMLLLRGYVYLIPGVS